MSTQMSQAALRALDQTEWLATSTLIQKPRVTAELGQIFQAAQPAEGEPSPLPDWNLVQDGNVLLLEHSAAKLREADQAHRKNIAELKKLRDRRRRIVVGFRDRYRSERKSFEGTYGEAALADVGLDAPPAKTYLATREQLLEFLERLRDPETPAKLGQPLEGHDPIDPSNVADAVDGEIEGYNLLMTEIREQRKRADETLIAKRQAIRENRRTIVNVARVQEGLYRLAGLDDLADRIRAATPRRRRRKEEETADDATPETPEDGEAPPTAAAPDAAVADEAQTF